MMAGKRDMSDKGNNFRTMKKLFALFLCFCSFSLAHGQDIDWTKTHDWKIYLISKFGEMYKVSIDSLSRYDSANIGQPAMMQYLQNVSKLPKGTYYWHGGYLCTAKIDSAETIKVFVSQDDGSLLVMPGHVHYAIPEGQRQKWLSYMHKNWIQLAENHRKKGNRG